MFSVWAFHEHRISEVTYPQDYLGLFTFPNIRDFMGFHKL